MMLGWLPDLLAAWLTNDSALARWRLRPQVPQNGWLSWTLEKSRLRSMILASKIDFVLQTTFGGPVPSGEHLLVGYG